jgi:hypothetical protein
MLRNNRRGEIVLRSQELIEGHRIKALKEGIKTSEDMIGKACRVYNSKEPLTDEQVQTLRKTLTK